MPNDATRKTHARAWHAEEPYDPKEIIRLEKACELVRADADWLKLDRRYELVDVGCGVGPLRPWLSAEDFYITGLELSSQAVEHACRNYDVCEQTDVEATWPLSDSSFDGVHAGAVLEHVVNWHAPLNEANRVLRPEGLLVVSVPNLRYWKEIRRLIRGRQPHWLRDMGHLHGYTPAFLRTLLEIHGFAVESVEADRVNLPFVSERNRRAHRRFAAWGSVLIVSARLARHVRIEDRSRAHEFPKHTPVGLRSIEVSRDCPLNSVS